MSIRVVVTGLGLVTPVGTGVASTWESLLTGRSGIGPITLFDASALDVRIAAEVRDFDFVERFGRKAARRNDRLTLFALECARQAVEDAGLAAGNGLGDATGVIIGTAVGGVTAMFAGYDVLKSTGPRRVSPWLAPMMMPNAPSAAIAITYGLRGPNFAVSSACASGSHAIGEAGEMIKAGRAPVVVAGGAETAIGELAVSGFANMGALSKRNGEPQRASRPFDAERDGFVLGEGAGLMVLESLEHARNRGARIYAELAGYAATSDAFHVTAPDEQGAGAARTMRLALASSGLQVEDIGYINAHGTGTLLNDVTETRAIRKVFGSHADNVLVSSTKSMIGHGLGASGGIEAVVSVRSLVTGWVHPTINYEHADPECDLDYVPNQARKADVRAVLSNSFGFGGHNACLVFRKWEE